MVTHRSSRGHSWVPFLVYLATFLLVISFIFFDVLDIDGSDFPASPGTLSQGVSQAEAEHDIRRLLARGNPPGEVVATQFVAQSASEDGQQHLPRSVRQALPDRTEHRFRPVLPRASLGDAPPVSSASTPV